MSGGISKSINLTSSSTEDHAELRRGPWTLGEDTLLIHYIAAHGEGRWNFVGKRSGLRRSGKSCRLRWLNYLKPDVKRGNLSPQEQLLILELHSKWGNRWSKIAQQLPGRTDNEIKNYWRTRMQKQARHLKIDTNSTAFHDIVRSLWMPRLLQKIQLPNSTVPPPPPPAPPLSNSQETPTIGGTIDHQELNSESSCISSSESTNISQSSEFPELPIGDNDHNGCYYVDNSSCFCLETNSQSTDFEYPVGDSHVSDNDWLDNDFAYSMWNVDELWQFRNF